MADYKLISADSHFNEVEATWKLARKKHGDRAPRIVWHPNPDEGEVGPYLVIDDVGSNTAAHRESLAREYLGFILGGTKRLTAQPTKAEDFQRKFQGYKGAGQIGKASSRAEEFRRDFRFEDYPGPSLDPVARLRDQDKDGVEAEVIYASTLRHCYTLSAKDEPFFHDLAESYNEWMMDFCSENPKRLIGLPVISVLNPEVAAKDIRDYARRGAKGFIIASSVPVGMNYGDPMFDPMWAAAAECGTPLSMHSSSGKFKEPNYNFFYGHHFVGHQVEIQISLGEMIYGRVFDRFPTLKIVVTEVDTGWVAYVVQRTGTFDPRLGLELSPAEYLRRNVWFTFQNDRVGMLTTPYFGVDNFLWASDYPHGVTTWPDSRVIVEQQMQGLSEEAKRKIVRQNTIDLYKLDL